MFATGLGSLPGTDFPGALRWTLDELGPHAYLPELPARGVGAGMIGKAVALLAGLGADLQPSGWRLTPGSGVDQRRAMSLWRRDLDELEEFAQGYDGELTVAVCGPLTLAASVSRPLGDLVLSDHGARRELAASLAEGYGLAVSEIRRRLPHLTVTAQVDEPMLPMVLAGRVPTASGFSRHRRVDVSEAVSALAAIASSADRAGATGSVLHCCAPGLDLDVAQRAGFGGAAIDPRLVSGPGWDRIGAWIESGRDLWLGVAATQVRDAVPSVDDLVRAALGYLRPLSLDPALLIDRVALTPACGLAGWTGPSARGVLTNLKRAVPLVSEEIVR